MSEQGSTGDRQRPALTRRSLLAATVTTVGLAGCGGSGSDSTPTAEPTETETQPDSLRLWLHPDSETVTGDDGVETWRDDSGNGYDFTQSAADRRPGLVDDAVNGHSALRFDGEDDSFVREDTLGVTNDSARTFFVVSRLSDRSLRSPYLMQGDFGSTETQSNYYGLEANTFGTTGDRFGAYLISYGYDAEQETDTNFHVHTLQTETFPATEDIRSSTTYYLDGAEAAISYAGGGSNSDTSFEGNSTAIGAFPQAEPSAVMHGDIAEVRVYDRALPDEERSSVEAALLDQYGIASE